LIIQGYDDQAVKMEGLICWNILNKAKAACDFEDNLCFGGSHPIQELNYRAYSGCEWPSFLVVETSFKFYNLSGKRDYKQISCYFTWMLQIKH
jgi:hypothetical protein